MRQKPSSTEPVTVSFGPVRLDQLGDILVDEAPKGKPSIFGSPFGLTMFDPPFHLYG